LSHYNGKHADIIRFLLAQLHLDSLAGAKSKKALRAALNTLPKGTDGYDPAYKNAMERIEGQVRNSRELAIHVLSWITCAKRLITTSELRHALAVELDTSELDEENLPEIEDMVSVCAGLVTVDEESHPLSPLHNTGILRANAARLVSKCREQDHKDLRYLPII
jgi:hypothetical protein